MALRDEVRDAAGMVLRLSRDREVPAALVLESLEQKLLHTLHRHGERVLLRPPTLLCEQLGLPHAEWLPLLAPGPFNRRRAQQGGQVLAATQRPDPWRIREAARKGRQGCGDLLLGSGLRH